LLHHLGAAIILAAFALISPVAAQPKYAKPSDIPVEAFADLPSFSGARLSPDGRQVGFFISLEGRKHLVVQNLDGSKRSILPPGEETTEFHYFFWKTNEMIITQIGLTGRRMEFRGGTIIQTRSVSFNVKTKEFKWLGKPNRRRNAGERMSQLEKIIDYLPDDPENILLQLDFRLDATPEVYKVNIQTGRRTMIKSGKKGVNSWYSDQNSEIRLGIGYRPRSDEKNIYYRTSSGEWLDINETEWSNSYEIVGFTDNPNLVYVQGKNEHGTLGLYSLDIESGTLQSHVFSHPEVDIAGMYYHPVTEHLAGVRYVDDFERTKYFDKDLSRLQRSFAKALPNEIISVVSKARDKELYLIYAESDTNPGDYYFYNRPERKLDWIASNRAPINPALMAKVQAVDIPVRDGTLIKAYLTKPKTHSPKHMPTIVLPHGGPHARDTATWDWWSQFYASRGYLVLQPNFRGSDGYGPAYKEAGENQWGGLMQDDVTDATKWLIAEGFADPGRICIVGASYGGYASLMGVIKEPELYKCAISVNGVTDLPKLKSHDAFSSLGGRDWIKTMGLEGADDETVSPYDRAEGIHTPLLLMSSEDDARIPYKHSRDMHNKLKRHNKQSRYVKIPNGTHSMVTAESRLIMLRETEKFLAKHIGK